MNEILNVLTPVHYMIIISIIISIIFALLKKLIGTVIFIMIVVIGILYLNSSGVIDTGYTNTELKDKTSNIIEEVIIN